MALVKCRKCGIPISTKAVACPSCGAKIARTHWFTKLVLGFIILGAGMAWFGNWLADRNEADADARETSRLATLSADQRAAEQKQKDAESAASAARTAQRRGLAWVYASEPDKMDGRVIKNRDPAKRKYGRI